MYLYFSILLTGLFPPPSKLHDIHATLLVTLTRSLLLQEGREGSAGEHGNGLLESLDLIITCSLTELKILQCEIAALVEVCILVHELLDLTHHSLMLSFSLNLLLLSLCFHVTLGDDVLGLCLNGCVGVLDEVFVGFLRIFLSANCLCLHGLGIINDALHHTHNTTTSIEAEDLPL